MDPDHHLGSGHAGCKAELASVSVRKSNMAAGGLHASMGPGGSTQSGVRGTRSVTFARLVQDMASPHGAEQPAGAAGIAEGVDGWSVGLEKPEALLCLAHSLRCVRCLWYLNVFG